MGAHRFQWKRKSEGGWYFAPGELERVGDAVVALIEEAARGGHQCPTARMLSKTLGISARTIHRILFSLKDDGKISWRLTNPGPGIVRIVTVKASGLTTALAPKSAPKPRVRAIKKPKASTFLLTAKHEHYGVSDRSIYGQIDYAVKILRRRGFPVFKEDHGIRVGNRLLQPWQVEQLAARERRLAGE